MAIRTVAYAVTICLLASGVAGCADLERRKDNLKAHGVEFEDMKVKRVFRF